MTREENIAKLAQLRSECESLAIAFNEANQGNKYAEAAKANDEIAEKVNEYTSIARELCFAECKATEDPMLEAVKRLSFTTIGIEDKKDEGETLPTRRVIEKSRAIDLAKLDKYCGGIGHDENWLHIAQKMNFLLTAQVCKDLGVDPKEVNDSYSMSEIAREFDMGKNPTSKTNLLKTLQTVINAMIGGEYKATSHDVNFLLAIYAKKNRKALSVTCANHKYFRNYVAEICHRIVLGKTYEVDYKKKKEN